MKTAILLAGTIAAGILGVLLVFGGLVALFTEPLSGLAILFLLVPIAFSLAIVFAQVSSQKEDVSNRKGEQSEESDRFSDIRGTPWENDPDPNRDRHPGE